VDYVLREVYAFREAIYISFLNHIQPHLLFVNSLFAYYVLKEDAIREVLLVHTSFSLLE